MQARLMVFVSMNTSGIPPAKAKTIGRTFPPLFTIKLPKEEQIIENLDDIEGMQVTIQAISFFICVVVGIIILYQICKRCRHTQLLITYCFPFLPRSPILRTTCRTDLFVEVTNLTKGNTAWAHFTTEGYFPTDICISRPILKETVQIETCWLCFKKMHIDWENTIVREMPSKVKVSIFMDNAKYH